MALSPAQTDALVAIVTQWDAADAAERKRWGVGLRGGIGVTVGTDAGSVAREVRTLHALVAAGFLELTPRVETADRLRRGSYRRWVTGAERLTYVTFVAKPTPAGRAWVRTLPMIVSP